MHRCLLSAALPARPRCVSSLSSSIRRPRAPPASRWLRYTSTSAEYHRDEASPAYATYSSNTAIDQQLEALKQGQLPAWTSSGSASDEGDSTDAMDLEFILEGYEAEPKPPAHEKRRRHARRVPASSGTKTKTTTGAQLKPAAQESKLNPRKLRSFVGSAQRGKPGSSYSERIGRARSARRRAIQPETGVPLLPQLWSTNPKYVSVNLGRGSTSWYSHAWNMNFARAQNHYDKLQEHSNFAEAKAPPILRPRAVGWADYAYDHLTAGRYPVASSEEADQRTVWSDVALWLLHYDKDTLVDFLLATVDVEPRPPPERVIDCLQLLSRHYGRKSSPEHTMQLRKLATVFCTMAGHNEVDCIRFKGGFLSTLLRACEPEQAQELYTAMKTGNFQINFYTWLHMAHYLVKHDHFQQGLDAVLESNRSRAQLRSYAFRSVCASLLRGSIKQPNGLRVCLRIVDNLINIGLTLNIHIYNVIILNAVEAGDLRTARQVYHSMADNGIHANEFTFAILLKGWKQDTSDVETLNVTIQEAIAGVDLSQHLVLATEMLHCLILHHTKHNHGEAWSTICQAYAQLFDLRPLEQIGLPIPQSVHDTLAWKQTMLPNAYAIDIMVRCYLFLALQKQSASQTRVYEMYCRFRAAVDARTPPFDSVTGTNTFNAFLVGFIKNKPTLVRAAEVIKDLQRPNSVCKPCEISWNIFLHGFTRHGQLKLAEQVLNYMRSKGIPWTNSTWDQLIAGYAGAQDADAVIDTIKRAEANGYQWNTWTYGGLRRLRESGKLREILAHKGKVVELDFSSEIKQGLGARIEEGYQAVEDRAGARADTGGYEVGVGTGEDKMAQESGKL